MTSPKKVTDQEQDATPQTDSREKVKARLLALEWNTNHPVTGDPVKVRQGDVVVIYRDMFDGMNDQFRPAWEEVSEGE